MTPESGTETGPTSINAIQSIIRLTLQRDIYPSMPPTYFAAYPSP